LPQVVNKILQKNLTTTRTTIATRTSHTTDGIQWILIEKLGKALSNRCPAVRALKNKKQKTQWGTRDRLTNTEQLEFKCRLKLPTRGRIYELLNLGASSSHNLFQSLITNQDLLRLREDMWSSHKTLRKGWWCRAFATVINRQCPTCNRLWTTEQISPSLTQCLTCSKVGAKEKPSRFKLKDNEVGLIFQSALPEDLEWDTWAEDVALSLDSIQRCLSNMLVPLDRDTPQMKNGLALPLTSTTQELMMTQEPPWVWFTLPQLEWTRVNYTEPTSLIKETTNDNSSRCHLLDLTFLLSLALFLFVQAIEFTHHLFPVCRLLFCLHASQNPACQTLLGQTP